VSANHTHLVVVLPTSMNAVWVSGCLLSCSCPEVAHIVRGEPGGEFARLLSYYQQTMTCQLIVGFCCLSCMHALRRSPLRRTVYGSCCIT
jgi:hypothetical protein